MDWMGNVIGVEILEAGTEWPIAVRVRDRTILHRSDIRFTFSLSYSVPGATV
jgi:hypothetical protein